MAIWLPQPALIFCSTLYAVDVVFCQAFRLSLCATAVRDTNENNDAQRCMKWMYKSLGKKQTNEEQNLDKNMLMSPYIPLRYVFSII